MTAQDTAAPTALAVAKELHASVDSYVRNLPDYQASGYTETNQIRLEFLIANIGRNPALISDNLEELFNRITIARLATASA